VKVLDFGLAAQIHTSMTRVSMAYHGTSGTGPYMAPEQWRGRAQGAAADQYALAVMAYEMLAGRLPFESTDPAVLREAVLNDTAENIVDLPGAAQNALKRAMSKEAAERFNSCADFAAALGGAKVAKSKKVSSGKSGGGAWKWIAAVIVLALIAAGAFFALNWTTATPTATSLPTPPP
ncbi:MAG: protein kinase, partial [Lentisphaeria bacterium]|nr:protein kinase [Lentisphaeria bacterium]